jgi:hypothetical protein
LRRDVLCPHNRHGHGRRRGTLARLSGCSRTGQQHRGAQQGGTGKRGRRIVVSDAITPPRSIVLRARTLADCEIGAGRTTSIARVRPRFRACYRFRKPSIPLCAEGKARFSTMAREAMA